MKKHILILGMGKSGHAVQKVCEQEKIPCHCFDDAEDYSSLAKIEALDLIDTEGKNLFVAISPGVSTSHELVRLALEKGCELGTEIDVAFLLSKKKIPPCIGVTGTNGKTTVVEFSTHALNQAGIEAEAVGNIGLPLVERVFLTQKPLPKAFVIELSSFQLEYTKRCDLQAGAYLNFAPDHLEWHKTLSAYHEAKSAIINHLIPNGALFVHPTVPLLPHMRQDVSIQTFALTQDADIGTDGEYFFRHGKKEGKLPEKLQGKLSHDTENFLSSCGLLFSYNLPYASCVEAWNTFQKGPHRIQLVDVLDSVSFYDDSKATNISSTEAAVKYLEGPIVLLAGGVHKGFSYASWKEVFQNKVVAIIAFGQAKEAIACDLLPDYQVEFASSLQDAFTKACAKVPPKGNVLLSPGCSSFDMFQNYKERGDQFQSLVKMAAKSLMQ